MKTNGFRPSKAEMLAALIEGTANQSHTLPTVQRSHRFPLHIFTQIEKLAKQGNVPASLIINELLECGLDAVKKELPSELVTQLRYLTDEDRQKKTTMERFDSEEYRKINAKKSRA